VCHWLWPANQPANQPTNSITHIACYRTCNITATYSPRHRKTSVAPAPLRHSHRNLWTAGSLPIPTQYIRPTLYHYLI